MKHRAIFLFLLFLETCEATQQCKTTSSVYGHYLNGHVISSMSAAGPGQCHRICDKDPKCKSMNFRLENKSCELNNADRFSHPQDYQERQASVYSDTSEPLKGVSVTLMTSQHICTLKVVQSCGTRNSFSIKKNNLDIIFELQKSIFYPSEL